MVVGSEVASGSPPCGEPAWAVVHPRAGASPLGAALLCLTQVFPQPGAHHGGDTEPPGQGV